MKGKNRPFFELFAMGIVLDAADHKVCKMAILMGNDII